MPISKTGPTKANRMEALALRRSTEVEQLAVGAENIVPRVLSQPDIVKTLKHIRPQNDHLKVLIALNPQPSLTIGSGPSLYEKLYSDPIKPPVVLSTEEKFIAKQLKSNSRFKGVTIEFCKPEEVQKKLEQAKHDDTQTSYDLLVMEPEARLVATDRLAKPLREISPRTYVMNFDRNGYVKTYTHQEKSPNDRGYTTVSFKDFNDIDSLFDRTRSYALDK